MGKILWGVFCLAIVLGTVVLSARADNARSASYDNCLKQFNSENIPIEGREGFLSSCMN